MVQKKKLGNDDEEINKKQQSDIDIANESEVVVKGNENENDDDDGSILPKQLYDFTMMKDLSSQQSKI